MKAVLRISSTSSKHVCEEEFPAFTDEQMDLFDRGEVGAPPIPSIASKTWRIDFSRGLHNCNYNAVAKREFVKHFLYGLKHGNYTERGPVSQRLRTSKHVGAAFETSVRYLRGVWKGAHRDPKLAAQASRRDTVRILTSLFQTCGL